MIKYFVRFGFLGCLILNQGLLASDDVHLPVRVRCVNRGIEVGSSFNVLFRERFPEYVNNCVLADENGICKNLVAGAQEIFRLGYNLGLAIETEQHEKMSSFGHFRLGFETMGRFGQVGSILVLLLSSYGLYGLYQKIKNRGKSNPDCKGI